MEIVTHGVTGLLVARAMVRGPDRTARAAVLAGALAPDLDVAAQLWVPLAPVLAHRLMTHSLLGGLPLSLLIAALVHSARAGGFWRLTGLAYLGLLSHIALDLFTPFGTGVLWPLDSQRWAVGSLYMVDPVITAIGVASLLPAAWWKRPGLRVARAGLLALVGYVILGALVMKGVEARWRETVTLPMTPVLQSAVVPAFPGPLRWVGVAETSRAILRSRFWAWRVTEEGGASFEKASPDPRISLVEGHWAVESFLKFARFPWRRAMSQGDALIVEYHELAFEDHPFGGPMVLRLKLEPTGVVQVLDLGHRF